MYVDGVRTGAEAARSKAKSRSSQSSFSARAPSALGRRSNFSPPSSALGAYVHPPKHTIRLHLSQQPFPGGLCLFFFSFSWPRYRHRTVSVHMSGAPACFPAAACTSSQRKCAGAGTLPANTRPPSPFPGVVYQRSQIPAPPPWLHAHPACLPSPERSTPGRSQEHVLCPPLPLVCPAPLPLRCPCRPSPPSQRGTPTASFVAQTWKGRNSCAPRPLKILCAAATPGRASRRGTARARAGNSESAVP